MLQVMVESAQFCASISRQVVEPVGGSAPESIAHWLLVEDNGPWGPKEPNALALLDPDLKAAWEQIGKTPQLRRIYLRRPKQLPTMPTAPRRFWLATSSEGGFQVFPLGPLSIAQFVERWARDGVEGLCAQAEACDDFWLVCTHGRRDRCCALHGMSLFSALEQACVGEVWQCSHLGGHRFAATALHLPSRYFWGRLTEEDASALASVGPQRRLVLPEKIRGHSGLSRRAQVLDLALRKRRAQWGRDCASELWSFSETSEVLEVPEGRLRLESGEARMVLGSCGDAAPKLRGSLVALWDEA